MSGDWLQRIFAPESMLASFLLLWLGGMGFYMLTAGLSWLYYYVWRRARFFPTDAEVLASERLQRRREWLWSLLNVLGNACLTAPIHHAMIAGHSRIYTRVADHGVLYLFASVLLVLVITEPLVYGAHRLLHGRLLYRLLHRHHHQFRTPTPWTSMAFHPLDSFLQAAPLHLLAFVLPLHAGVYFFFLMFLQLWSTFIHERVTWVRGSLINSTAHHTLHHHANKYNLGQFFTLCDRAFGTYRSPVGLVYDGAEHLRAQRLERAQPPGRR